MLEGARKWKGKEKGKIDTLVMVLIKFCFIVVTCGNDMAPKRIVLFKNFRVKKLFDQQHSCTKAFAESK